MAKPEDVTAPVASLGSAGGLVHEADYSSPPVHEVIISVLFSAPAPDREIEPFGPVLKSRYGEPQRMEQQEFTMGIGPGGQQLAQARKQFDGWQVVFGDASRVIRISRTLLSMNVVRPGPWPRGEYPGWPTISREFAELFAVASNAYRDLGIQRIGLRYLNRIAIPRRTQLNDWFAFIAREPQVLSGPYAVALRETWEHAADNRDVSATVGLATIEIEEPTLKENNVGLLFDIDMFNLWPADAPSLDGVLEWLERAHSAERAVFESLITSELRERFGVIR